MLCSVTNNSADIVLDGLVYFDTSTSIPVKKTLKNNAQLRSQSFSAFRINTEDLIRLEMAFISEVESVFVEHSNGETEFRVFTVVNKRDADVRARIYRREQAIIDACKNLDFEFQIIARRDRDLKDVISGLGEPIFVR